jgi:hypothetical protein
MKTLRGERHGLDSIWLTATPDKKVLCVSKKIESGADDLRATSKSAEAKYYEYEKTKTRKAAELTL